MGINKKTIKDLKLAGKRVLLRADYNVPETAGRIDDDYRIEQSLPTINYLLKKEASLVICSHLGRPKGQPAKELSLKPIAERISRLLGKDVQFVQDCIGDEVKQAAAKLKPGQILLLENLRFHQGEEANDLDFAMDLKEATGAEYFVQDGFGVVHRAHASTDAITRVLPSVAGLLLQKEVETITKALHDPQRPLVAVVGGAKISDKIEVLNKFIELADGVAVAGALANNFLLAERIKIGKSLVEKEAMDIARDILNKARVAEKKRNFSFFMPVDAVVSTSKDGTKPSRVVDLASHSLADIEAYPKKPHRAAHEVAANELILDIGPISASYIAGAVKMTNTVIWSGTCGVTETKGLAGSEPPFGHGTRLVVDAMIGDSNVHKNKPFSLVGGGDTVAYVESEGLVRDFNHVSTGGSASLDLMAGKKLPGIESLLDKKKTS